MLINGKYAYDYLHYLSDPRLDASTMYVNNHYRQQEVYLSSANLFNVLPGWNLNLSADFQWNKLNADLVDFVYPTRYTGLIALATAINFQRLNIQASLLGTFVNDKTRVTNAAADSKQKYTPTIILSWQPWEEKRFEFQGILQTNIQDAHPE